MGYMIKRQYDFSAAHILVGHEGKCSRLHGHNYKVFVYVMSDALILRGSSSDMVMDFENLDKVVKPVIDRLDHRFIAKGNEWPVERADLTGKLDIHSDILVIGVRTTAENLARWIYLAIQRDLDEDLELKVEVQETEKSSACYPN